ncbi:hypothetical protein BCR33DRAFT_736370 [Rhizoclosmatium globosum]|uniref:Glycosyltransferase family 71 protein n=1 Tax=Rhizoclosmatium globosum TaxID=329046 RepID=A0A1Y2CIH9_9FUNG|nr:hypothetical protein BCR33DRAFT_736370 [Rhizoclosmatium globosum]|eukprot:ORY46853.1 hypothetical protein BCR33DRAFT_736370 [Rhizoclosmatium globosum]
MPIVPANDDSLNIVIKDLSELRKEKLKAISGQQAFADDPAIMRQTQLNLLSDLEKTIDLDQVQILDYLNGEEGLAHDSVFGGSLLNLEAPFDFVSTWKRVHLYAILADPGGYNYESVSVIENRGFTSNKLTILPDYHEMSRRVRANLIAYTILYEKPSLKNLLLKHDSLNPGNDLVAELESLTKGLTEALYPWFKSGSIRDWQLKFQQSRGTINDTGIVMTGGDGQIETLIHSIVALRTIMKCDLPIEVHFAGEYDLSHEMSESLRVLPNVTPIDLMKIFPDELYAIASWSVKPFAILASSFQKVIFLDADALFFQDPSTLTGFNSFTQYGQVFFHDRGMEREVKGYSQWFKKINPQMSKYASSLRFPNALSWHEQESGVVVVDKSRTGILHSLLFTCAMNSNANREETYAHVFGDKETFWMAMDMARVPYKFVKGYAGALGFREGNSVCGSNYHVDEKLRPMWWNGGILLLKHSSDKLFVQFKEAAVDLDRGIDKWEKEIGMKGSEKPMCFRPVSPKAEIVVLSEELREIGSKYIDLHLNIVSDGWKHFLSNLSI